MTQLIGALWTFGLVVLCLAWFGDPLWRLVAHKFQPIHPAAELTIGLLEIGRGWAKSGSHWAHDTGVKVWDGSTLMMQDGSFARINTASRTRLSQAVRRYASGQQAAKDDVALREFALRVSGYFDD